MRTKVGYCALRIGQAALLFAAALVCASAFGANPCALDVQDGIGGTGVEPAGTTPSQPPDGISGTRASPAPRAATGGAQTEDDGIGGTGIVGTITGFASVCVNGIEVHVDASTRVDANGAAFAPNRLAIGHVVAVDARGHGPEVHARRISVLFEVAGPITAIDRSGGRIHVMGQAVDLAGA
ncbi:MAG TPA: DUF5666 domain-containing protein, partial [Candidatus Cybelea sp.]|nr:DUF5666 domain-containing protein [Candidatus Cybelea sp.]